MNDDDRGQATVEFALVLPIVVMLALVIVQVALVVREDLLIQAAAREAARAASVDPDPGSAVAAAQRIAPGAEVRVRRSGVGEPVEVELATSMATDVPMVGPILPTVTLRAEAVMRAER